MMETHPQDSHVYAYADTSFLCRYLSFEHSSSIAFFPLVKTATAAAQHVSISAWPAATASAFTDFYCRFLRDTANPAADTCTRVTAVPFFKLSPGDSRGRQLSVCPAPANVRDATTEIQQLHLVLLKGDPIRSRSERAEGICNHQ